MSFRFAVALCAAFVLTGCQNPKPPPPPADPESCADFAVAEKKSVRKALKNAGLSAKETVQTAVSFITGGEPTLIGGAPADPKAWPASVYARSGNSACSATVIGERTVIIAAHCVGNGGTISFTAAANAYSARCSHHPAYRGNSTADWALCLTNRPVTGVPFENLWLSERPKVGQEVRLTGYGCTRPGGGGGNDGTFRIGKATVRSLPSGTNYDTVTVGGAALCFGDSGGAAYIELADGKRGIFGINSRGNISTTSYLSSVFTAAFRDWATNWAAANANARICGMHSDALGCRDAKVDPEPEPEPEPGRKFVVKTKAACVEGTVAKGFEKKLEEIKGAVRTALEQF